MSGLIFLCQNSGSFSPQSVRLTTRFVVDKMAQELELLQFPLLIIFPPQPHTPCDQAVHKHNCSQLDPLLVTEYGSLSLKHNT
jgi:hypothetical protein